MGEVVTLWISIVLMVLVWLFLAAILTLILLEALALLVNWNLLLLALVGFLSIFYCMAYTNTAVSLHSKIANIAVKY